MIEKAIKRHYITGKIYRDGWEVSIHVDRSLYTGW